MKNAIFDPEEYVRQGGTIIDYDPQERELFIRQKQAGMILTLLGLPLLLVFWPLGLYLLLVGLYATRTKKKLIKAV